MQSALQNLLAFSNSTDHGCLRKRFRNQPLSLPDHANNPTAIFDLAHAAALAICANDLSPNISRNIALDIPDDTSLATSPGCARGPCPRTRSAPSHTRGATTTHTRTSRRAARRGIDGHALSNTLFVRKAIYASVPGAILSFILSFMRSCSCSITAASR